MRSPCTPASCTPGSVQQGSPAGDRGGRGLRGVACSAQLLLLVSSVTSWPASSLSPAMVTGLFLHPKSYSIPGHPCTPRLCQCTSSDCSNRRCHLCSLLRPWLMNHLFPVYAFYVLITFFYMLSVGLSDKTKEKHKNYL